MKAKIHIDIGQYEFVEFEIEDSPENMANLYPAFRDAYILFHNMGGRVLAENAPKKNWKRPPEEFTTDTDKLSAL